MLFKKNGNVVEAEFECVDENEEETEVAEEPKTRDWKKILKWTGIGVGSVIGAIAAGLIAKNSFADSASEDLWYDFPEKTDDEENEEAGDENEDNDGPKE